jgi:ADP-ribosylglycohydrolase
LITKTELIENKKSLFEKSYGALIGLAIGDSLGDLARMPESHEKYGITIDLDAAGAWSTDDTEFTLMIANELIEHNGCLTTETAVETWMRDVVSVSNLGFKTGESEKGAAENLRRGIRPPFSGIDNSYNQSDGAAMRVAPIGVIHPCDPKKAAEMAAIEAEISHALDGIWGAQAVAASVAVAMGDGSVDEIINAGRSYIPDDSWLGRAFDSAMRIVKQAEGNLLKAWNPLHEALWTPYRASNPEALPSAYALFSLTKGDFYEGVIASANFGRDADTIAALVGTWCGALHGAGSIPSEWIEKCRFPAGRSLPSSQKIDIREIAQKLVQIITKKRE